MRKKILAVCFMAFIPGIAHAFGFEHKTTHVLENSLNMTSGVHDFSTHEDYLYIVLGKEYAPDVHVVDIADPINPVTVAKWTNADLDGVLSFQDIIVHGDYMYMTGVHELVVFDISDMNSPILIERISQIGLGNGVGIVVDDILYIRANAAWSDLYIYDVSDPGTPVFTSVLSDDDDTLLAGFGDFVSKRGDYLFITQEGVLGSPEPEGMQVVDVSDPENPVAVRAYVGEQYSFRHFDSSRFGAAEMVVTTERQKFAQASFGDDGTLSVAEGTVQLLYHTDDVIETDSYVVAPYETNGGGMGLYHKVDTGQVVSTFSALSPSVLSGDVPSLVAISGLARVGDYAFAIIDGSIDNFGSHQIEIFSMRDHVYRFWSDNFQAHFYTSSFVEKRTVRSSDPNWSYEGVSYETTLEDGGGVPTYRFWSPLYQNHFYTISQAERDSIIANDPNWVYEGESFYVSKNQSDDLKPVYRFYSDNFKGHFFTPSQDEKEFVQANDPNWSYEGIAWYVR